MKLILLKFDLNSPLQNPMQRLYSWSSFYWLITVILNLSKQYKYFQPILILFDLFYFEIPFVHLLKLKIQVWSIFEKIHQVGDTLTYWVKGRTQRWYKRALFLTIFRAYGALKQVLPLKTQNWFLRSRTLSKYSTSKKLGIKTYIFIKYILTSTSHFSKIHLVVGDKNNSFVDS